MNLMSRGVKIEADDLFSQDLVNQNDFDAIVLPGGLGGANTFRDSTELIETLKRFLNDDQKIVGAICASPAIVLQTNKLLENYDQVTCYPSMKNQLEEKWTDSAPVIRCKNLITSQGPGTSVEFSVALIEALFGNEKAK